MLKLLVLASNASQVIVKDCVTIQEVIINLRATNEATILTNTKRCWYNKGLEAIALFLMNALAQPFLITIIPNEALLVLREWLPEFFCGPSRVLAVSIHEGHPVQLHSGAAVRDHRLAALILLGGDRSDEDISNGRASDATAKDTIRGALVTRAANITTVVPEPFQVAEFSRIRTLIKLSNFNQNILKNCAVKAGTVARLAIVVETLRARQDIAVVQMFFLRM